MNLRQLGAFRAVMLAGTVTGAGERLRLTQPTVSKLIAQLERQAGMQLFDRVGGRLVARPEALELFRQVDKVFEVIEETGRSARQLAKGRAGHLRVVAIPALALELLPHAVAGFLAKRPDVTLAVDVRPSSYVLEWIAGRRADLGFASVPLDGPDVVMEPFVSAPGVCLLPRKHALAAKARLTPADLQGERFISLGRETAFRHFVDKAFEDAGVARRIVVEVGYAATACALVAEGVGVAIVDPLSALGRGRRADIVLRPFRPAVAFTLNAFFPAHAASSILAREFLDHLRSLWSAAAKDLQRHLAEPQR